MFMISHITGTIIDSFEKGYIVENTGIGYQIYTTSAPTEGSVHTFYIHEILKEDVHDLYGFDTKKERLLFTLLISVGGVGPKTALTMLGLYDAETLGSMIRQGDVRGVSLTPGIGKKTAERLVLELKDKMALFTQETSKEQTDLYEALLSLGYKDHTIKEVIPHIDTTLSLQQQIGSALRQLQK
jgi:Holliday junction DNA helicase RuvA